MRYRRNVVPAREETKPSGRSMKLSDRTLRQFHTPRKASFKRRAGTRDEDKQIYVSILKNFLTI